MSINGGLGGPQTFSSASGGKIYGYNNISESAPRVVAQGNPSRQQITFYNPGSANIFVGPSFVQNILGTAPGTPSNVALVPTSSLTGGCFLVSANGGTVTLSGECQGAYQAIGASGSGSASPLTVMESNT